MCITKSAKVIRDYLFSKNCDSPSPDSPGIDPFIA